MCKHTENSDEAWNNAWETAWNEAWSEDFVSYTVDDMEVMFVTFIWTRFKSVFLVMENHVEPMRGSSIEYMRLLIYKQFL